MVGLSLGLSLGWFWFVIGEGKVVVGYRWVVQRSIVRGVKVVNGEGFQLLGFLVFYWVRFGGATILESHLKSNYGLVDEAFLPSGPSLYWVDVDLLVSISANPRFGSCLGNDREQRWWGFNSSERCFQQERHYRNVEEVQASSKRPMKADRAQQCTGPICGPSPLTIEPSSTWLDPSASLMGSLIAGLEQDNYKSNPTPL
eukprot:Gb_32596 [translate_table: standard]